jgi:hypothetical protein
MERRPRIFRTLFWVVLIGLLVFIVALGMPFLSKFVASHVLAAAGCTAASFDMQAKCPPGSLADRFVPFAHWFTTFLSPYLLIRQFWDVLLVWGGVALGLGVLSSSTDAGRRP